MASFLAYFDLLGYKKFIENNTVSHLDYRTNHFGRNIEMALSLDHPNLLGKTEGVVISDISHSTLNCLTFSDTVIFWTNSNNISDFEELIQVAYRYNSFNVLQDFPSRGCIVYGELWFKPFDSENLRGGRYILNMIYGKALIDAHLKAEGMSWAGCELDISAIEYAKTLGDISSLLRDYTMLYDIPFKTKEGDIRLQGHALRLFRERILITEHYQKGIETAFTQDNKGTIYGRTKVIFDNTIEFLKAHQISFPFYYHMQSNKGKQIFGKFEADYTHIIIEVVQEGEKISHSKEITKFDRYNSDRDFLDAEQISQALFDEQLQKTV